MRVVKRRPVRTPHETARHHRPAYRRGGPAARRPGRRRDGPGLPPAVAGGAAPRGPPRLTTRLVGTPSYLAPELVGGGEPGPPGDIFSLGATLVFAATGTPLVNQGTMLEQLVQISTGRFDLSAVPRELRP